MSKYRLALADAAACFEHAAQSHADDPDGSAQLRETYAEGARLLRAWSDDPARNQSGEEWEMSGLCQRCLNGGRGPG